MTNANEPIPGVAADPASQEAAAKMIEAVIARPLPDDTTVLGVSEDGAIDSFLRAKLLMTPDGFGALVESVDLADTDFENDRRYLFGADDGWWDPSVPGALPIAQATTAPGRILNLGVDWSDPSRPVVYLFWHST